jgi:hypothetical protein
MEAIPRIMKVQPQYLVTIVIKVTLMAYFQILGIFQIEAVLHKEYYQLHLKSTYLVKITKTIRLIHIGKTEMKIRAKIYMNWHVNRSEKGHKSKRSCSYKDLKILNRHMLSQSLNRNKKRKVLSIPQRHTVTAITKKTTTIVPMAIKLQATICHSSFKTISISMHVTATVMVTVAITIIYSTVVLKTEIPSQMVFAKITKEIIIQMSIQQITLVSRTIEQTNVICSIRKTACTITTTIYSAHKHSPHKTLYPAHKTIYSVRITKIASNNPKNHQIFRQ